MAKFISDEEMQKLDAKPTGKRFISDEEMNSIDVSPKEDGSLLDSAKDAGMWGLENVIAPVGRFVDSYTGAPTRAAAMAGLNSENPISAFAGQFGSDPSNAPSGKQIAQRLGASETSLSDVLPSLYSDTGEGLPLERGGFLDPTQSGAAGLGVDVLTDWTNVVPPVAAAKLAGKGAIAATKGAGALTAGVTKGALKAGDVLTGTGLGSKIISGAQKTKEATGDIASRISKFATPEQSKDFSRFLKIAKDNGIDPSLLSDAIEFGPESFISRSTRQVAEGPIGQNILKSHNKGLEQVNEALNNKITQIGKGVSPKDALEAGQIIRGSYDKTIKDLFKNIDLTYNNVEKYAPGIFIEKNALNSLSTKLDDVDSYAKNLINIGTDAQVAQGKHLLRTTSALRRSNGSFRNINEQRKWIGNYAFADKTPMGSVPPDVKKMQELYRSINDALSETVKKDINPEFAKEILANNEKMTKFYKDQSPIVDIIKNSGTADESVFKKLFSDSKKAASLKTVLGEKNFAGLKSAYLNSLIKKNADGDIIFASTLKNIERNTPILKSIMDTKELKDVTDVLKLGNEFGSPILSSSGTGASGVFGKLRQAVNESLVNKGVVDTMKKRARDTGRTIPAKESKGPSIKEISVRLAGKRSSGTGQRLKALQSISPSIDNEQKRKNRIKALEK